MCKIACCKETVYCMDTQSKRCVSSSKESFCFGYRNLDPLFMNEQHQHEIFHVSGCIMVGMTYCRFLQAALFPSMAAFALGQVPRAGVLPSQPFPQAATPASHIASDLQWTRKHSLLLFGSWACSNWWQAQREDTFSKRYDWAQRWCLAGTLFIG